MPEGVEDMDLPTVLSSGVSFLRQNSAVNSIDKWLYRMSHIPEWVSPFTVDLNCVFKCVVSYI